MCYLLNTSNLYRNPSFEGYSVANRHKNGAWSSPNILFGVAVQNAPPLREPKPADLAPYQDVAKRVFNLYITSVTDMTKRICTPEFPSKVYRYLNDLQTVCSLFFEFCKCITLITCCFDSDVRSQIYLLTSLSLNTNINDLYTNNGVIFLNQSSGVRAIYVVQLKSRNQICLGYKKGN